MKNCVYKSNSKAVIVFFVTLVMCALVVSSIIQAKLDLEREQMTQLVLKKSNSLNEVLLKLLYKTEALSSLVIQSNGQVESFERVAATIIDDPAIRNIIIAPNGIVNAVYPYEANKSLIGYNLLGAGEGNLEALAAIRNNQLTLGGPFELKQGGGKALVGRLPVYLNYTDNDKIFWGLVSVTLNYPQALNGANLDELIRLGFGYEIWRINPDNKERQIIYSNNFNHKTEALEKKFNILNAEWIISIAPLKTWYQYPESWMLIAGALLLSLLAAVIAKNYFDLTNIKEELENMVRIDHLTGALTRKGLFDSLAELLSEYKVSAKANPFVLCYIDLNNFKGINDCYGHAVGDKVLINFARVILAAIGKQEHMLARIGGDEFVVVLKDCQSIEQAQAFFAKIKAELKEPLYMINMDNTPLYVSVSIGFAEYPADGRLIDELMLKADKEMYREKLRYKENTYDNLQ